VTYRNECYAYNPDNHEWEPFASLLSARTYAAATAFKLAHDYQWWVLGGEDGHGSVGKRDWAVKSSDIFSATSRKWSVGPLMNYPRKGHCIVQLNHKKFLVAGGESCNVECGRHETYIYDWGQNKWSRVGN